MNDAPNAYELIYAKIKSKQYDGALDMIRDRIQRGFANWQDYCLLNSLSLKLRK